MLNIQDDPKQVLKFIYQFLLRPEVLPLTASLININHTFKIFGLLSARNQLVLEMKKVGDDLKSAIDRHHIELIADYISFKGVILPLKIQGLKIYTDDW